MVKSLYAYIHILLVFALSLLIGCSDKQESPSQEKLGDLSTEERTAEQTPELTVSNAFIKELPPGQSTAALYLVISNATKITQTLSYAHSPVAETIEVHRVIYNEGVMQMRPVKHLHVNPGQKLVFKPGGYHFMVFGISEELAVGDTFPLTMEFQSGVELTVEVKVIPHG